MSDADANILILPVWKKGATAEEWFYDLAMLARKHPERFKHMVLIYEEVSADDKTSKVSYYCHGMNTTELFGLIELGKHKVWERVRWS